MTDQKNADLHQFAFIAAHDLKAPLNAIIQLTDLLEMKYNPVLDDKGRKLTRAITESAQKMRTLINDLLDYSRAISGAESDTAKSGPAELDAALANLKPAIEESSALISFGHIPDVKVPPLAMTQVFQNLIGNAILYRGAKIPRITINAVRQDGSWLFTVSDNGIGIEDKFHETIFEPFQRLHGSDLPGNGIGLALCRKVVERAGGEIWVESAPGEGSIFHFLLPTAETVDSVF